MIHLRSTQQRRQDRSPVWSRMLDIQRGPAAGSGVRKASRVRPCQLKAFFLSINLLYQCLLGLNNCLLQFFCFLFIYLFIIYFKCIVFYCRVSSLRARSPPRSPHSCPCPWALFPFVYLPNRKKAGFQANLYMNRMTLHRSFICNIHKMETTQVSITEND